jgi:hypothetical protein
MKKLLLSILILVSLQCFSQDDDEKPAYYETNPVIPISVTECDIAGTAAGAPAIVADFKSQFYKIDEVGSNVIITFLFYTTKLNEYNIYNATSVLRVAAMPATGKLPALPASQRKYFLMSKTAFEKNCTPVYSRKLSKSAKFTSSAITLPVKLRLKDFDFDKNFSLGISGGIKNRISKYSPNYINALIALNISTSDLDSFSTKGKVAGQPIKNVATFSPALGIVFEFGKAQIGIFSGVDLMSKANRNKFDWIYHGKPWISLGFGISILGKEGDNKKAKTGNDSQPIN